MSGGSQPRRDYEQSCRELQRAGWLEAGQVPSMPARRPGADDDGPLGVSFFRTRVSGEFSNMTLPRTFFGRSEVRDASFRNTDLSESTLCWNDFIAVDFSDGSLRRSDLRAAEFSGVSFARCDMRDADLRRSHFENCDFAGADLRGAKLTRDQAVRLGLEAAQREGVAWQDTDGEEPDGG